MSPGKRPIQGTRPASINMKPTTAMTTPTMTSARPISDMASFEEATLTAWGGGRLLPQVQVCLSGHTPPSRCAHHEADLQEVGLHQLGEGLRFVVDRRRDGLDSHRATTVVLDDR